MLIGVAAAIASWSNIAVCRSRKRQINAATLPLRHRLVSGVWYRCWDTVNIVHSTVRRLCMGVWSMMGIMISQYLVTTSFRSPCIAVKRKKLSH